MARRPDKTAGEGRTFFQRMESGIWGLGIAVLGVLMFMALTSALLLQSGPGGESNLVGPVGRHLAKQLLFMLGLSSLVLSVLVVMLGAMLIAQRLADVRREHLLGAAVTLLPLAVALELLSPAASSLEQGWGGLLGRVLGEWLLVRLVGRTGTWLLSLAFVVAGLSIIFRIHVKSFFWVPYLLVRRLAEGLFARRTVDAAEGRGAEDGEEAAGESPGSVAQATTRGRVVRGEEPAGRPALAAAPSAAEQPAPPGASGKGAGGREATRAARPPGAPPPIPAVEVPKGGEAGAANSGEGAVVKSEPDLLSEEEVEWEEEEGSGSSTAAGGKGAVATGNAGQIPISGRVIQAPEPTREFEMPDVGLLDFHPPAAREVDEGSLREAAAKLEQKLQDFRIDGEVGDIHPGPVIALYEFKPGRGIKLSTISSLSKDIAMALAAEQVRIVAPIPGRDVVGFEIPNKVREMVYLRDLLSHSSYKAGKHRLPLVLGKDISGKPAIADLTRMPHLLVAGTTGSGKSVALHAFLMSIIYRCSPEQVKFIFVDPKMLELTAYAEIPHLLLPVVTEARDAAIALSWAVSEMERRNRLMSVAGVPNITEYNQLVKRRRESPALKADVKMVRKRPDGELFEETVLPAGEDEELPYIVVVIDELADLMMVAGRHVESSVARLAQMARAAGIHMIIATQNPTIKVVTGIIKANMPSRISFKVRTMQDSRVVLDQNGADDLLGFGDMLFLGPGSSKLVRIHGAFVSTEERNRVVDYLRTQGEPQYNMNIMKALEAREGDDDGDSGEADFGEGRDDIYNQAVAVAVAKGKISTSALQRELGIGYNKAAVMMSRMERDGIVGPPEAAGKPRVVLRSR